MYASDVYGFMLCDLASQASQSYLKSWNTFVKLAWNVPLNTYTYLVENCLAENFVPLRKQVCSRYAKFFQSLFSSTSKEVRHLARIVSRDAKSTVYKNVQFLLENSGLSPWDFSNWKIMQKIENSPVPPNNGWRLSLLKKLLATRSRKKAELENCDDLSKMIDSLCTT